MTSRGEAASDRTGRGQVRLHGLIDDAARRRPEAVAVRDERGVWSYAELTAQSRRVAAWLRDRGVGRGDRLLLRTANRREQVAVIFGASRVGAIVVPVHRDIKQFMLRDLIADSDPVLSILHDDDEDCWSALDGRPGVGVTRLWHELDGLAGSSRATGGEVAGISCDPCLMIYTSGSTSRPKAVVSNHAQVVFATTAIADRLGYRPDDVVFVRLPLSFDYGLYQVFLAALSTAALVFNDSSPDFTLARQIRDSGATVVPLVPSIAATLVKLADRRRAAEGAEPPSQVRLFTNTGSVLAPALIARLRAAYPAASICLMFGITECKRVSILEPDGDLVRPGSVGTALPGTEVLILSEAGVPVPPGTVGEIVVRGPHVMTGYWQAPDLTAGRFRAEPRTGERRLHTGDYGYLDDDGHLYFSGRRDDIVKRRGMRVSLTEIESAVGAVPDVRECAVVHQPEGDRLVACVTGPVDPDDLIRRLAGWLDVARLPDACRVLAQLPMTPNGKIDRKALLRMTEEATA
ncbi:class I adenylate-forming enzyme family protein [Plantactinospora soyae]|uniref:Acyl-CoA synthetase (AMP-forming)/AMP-acid ligase II n=1 Tax=Plantactinospora soyae TaxID=1544732 RepID=A0A927LZU4_9ACTN|nr:AMP-binding protein [Plantactinospora soyae]MBE1485542.1 acyl-CoA synthetase (AMP-forming)/AMP-acid ligase II [Plantactinospora soyae]